MDNFIHNIYIYRYRHFDLLYNCSLFSVLLSFIAVLMHLEIKVKVGYFMKISKFLNYVAF